MEEEFAKEDMPGQEDSPNKGTEARGSGGVGRPRQTATSRGLILVPGYKVPWPALSMIPLWSPALGKCPMETPKPGGNATSDSRFQSPGPREHRARSGGN